MLQQRNWLIIILLVYFTLSSMLIFAQDEVCQEPEGWESTYTVQAGDNLFRIAQGYDVSLNEIATANCLDNIQVLHVGQILSVPNPANAHPQFIHINMILNGDNGTNGTLLGCGDSAVRVPTNRIATGDTQRDLQVSLEELFNPNEHNVRPAELVNDWTNYEISIVDIKVDSGFALINLEGEFLRPGHCGDARLEGLLWHTILMYPEVTQAIVTLNGQNLNILFDESGLATHEASYYRSMTADTCPIPIGWHPYEVQAGDNLFRISLRANSDLNFVSSRNCINDPSAVEAGTIIHTPSDINVSDS